MIARQLWHTTKDGRASVMQGELLARAEPAVVILGEAGAGKTFLLNQLGEQMGVQTCRARQLIASDVRAILGNATTLVIDALDEVPAHKNGDAVDAVLTKLSEAAYPRFVLSCRVADWRGASAAGAIGDQYGTPPLELHLEPLTDAEAQRFLAEPHGDFAGLGDARAAEVVAHFKDYGLDDFLGNPHTLELIEEAAGQGPLPTSRRALFAQVVQALRRERNPAKGRQELSETAALDMAGAAFATLLLSGKEAIGLEGSGQVGNDLALADLSAFAGADVARALDTRLFQAVAPSRFTYQHRRVAEYLGAQWLAKRADTRGKRSRLHAQFLSGGLVPTHLRGLHAWLATDPRFAELAIAADPMGVIEYGDADDIDAGQGRAMLTALRGLAEDNPRFRDWGPYRAKGLVQPALLPEVRDLITAPATPYGLRLLILQQLDGASVADAVTDALRMLLFDTTAYFGARSAAGDALARLPVDNWPALIERLRVEATHDATRLAAEMLDEVGYDRFDDDLIVAVIGAHAGLTLCPLERQRRERVVGSFLRIQKHLADDRLDGILDRLAATADTLLDRRSHENGDIINLAFALILRRLALGPVDPLRLWAWLKPFDPDGGHRREHSNAIADWLRANDETRRAIQRHVLLELPGDKNVRQRAWRLSRRSLGLALDNADVVAAFAALEPADRQDLRWRELVWLAQPDGETGAEVRATAKAYLGNWTEMVEWVESLAVPPMSATRIGSGPRLPRLRMRDSRRSCWPCRPRNPRSRLPKATPRGRAGTAGRSSPPPLPSVGGRAGGSPTCPPSGSWPAISNCVTDLTTKPASTACATQ